MIGEWLKRYRQKGLLQVHLRGVVAAFGLALITSCSTLPSLDHEKYSYPTGTAYHGNVNRPYRKLGLVRSKVNFVTLDPGREEADLCKNYFNKAVRELVKIAKARGADAIIDVKSVVFLEDGHMEIYPTPECSDDGMEGQALAQGIAVQWKHPSQIVKKLQ